MVNVEAHLPKGEFSENPTISSTMKEFPDGNLAVLRIEEVQITDGPRTGQRVLVMDVKDGEKIYTYWPNKTSIANIASKYGNESNMWVGKEITLKRENMMVRGKKVKAIFAEPL